VDRFEIEPHLWIQDTAAHANTSGHAMSDISFMRRVYWIEAIILIMSSSRYAEKPKVLSFNPSVLA
jgi:hypothetical protein